MAEIDPIAKLEAELVRIPRAAFIRELLAVQPRITNKAIRKRCLEAGYDEPRPEAIYRARNYVTKGRAPASRPTYAFLWDEFLEAHAAALAKGIPVAVTQRMKDAMEVAQRCRIQDRTREPLTSRRVKKKRKAKTKP